MPPIRFTESPMLSFNRALLGSVNVIFILHHHHHHHHQHHHQHHHCIFKNNENAACWNKFCSRCSMSIVSILCLMNNIFREMQILKVTFLFLFLVLLMVTYFSSAAAATKTSVKCNRKYVNRLMRGKLRDFLQIPWCCKTYCSNITRVQCPVRVGFGP